MDNNFNNGLNKDFNNQNYDQNYNQNNQSYNEFNGGNMNFAPQQPAKDPGHGLAIASLVLGIISILSCCCVYLSVLVGVVGVVLAIVSKSKSYSGTMETMAKVGMTLSIIGVVLSVGYIILGVVMMQSPLYQETYQETYEEMMKILEQQ